MKKIISICIIGFLLLSGIGTVAVENDNNHEDVEYSEKILTSSKIIPSVFITQSEDKYVDLRMEGSSNYLMKYKEPILPKIVEVFELPFGAQNIKINVITSDIKEYEIPGIVRPAPTMLPLSTSSVEKNSLETTKNTQVYSTNKWYPQQWYTYNVGCGLNSANKRVTQVSVPLYPVRYNPVLGQIQVAENAEIKISYDEPNSNPFPTESKYDMLIIAPKKFSQALQPLIRHKNNNNVTTLLRTTESIYGYIGRDKPEKIKRSIRDAIEQYGITYVLLVGGLKSTIYARPRDDCNQGSRGWHIPVRYTNMYDNPKFPLSASNIHDPGVLCDLYYADIYGEGGKFETWDPNNDDIFAAWNKEGVENDTGIDMRPDVCLGRLACRNRQEVRTVVNKIINYENSDNSDWFKKMTVVSGDGFLDQQDLNFTWDTKELPDGEYIICGQSLNASGGKGPVDKITVTLDQTSETNITFNHDDHLNPALEKGYPAPPITEIVTISDGDILGNTDFNLTPGEGIAYCNNFNPWANIKYEDGVLTIRGKSYAPEPYGNVTDVHVWINNSENETVYSDWRNNTEMYYEGEWTTGEKALLGRGGALYYMPSDFEKDIVWASQGTFTGQDDVIDAVSEGSGFLFFSGHGSPNVWADHYPGVPGNRGPGSITGLRVTSLSVVTSPSLPLYPIDKLSNGKKLPIAVVGGCHNSQFNVSMLMGIYDILPHLFDLPKSYMWCHGGIIPECFSWRLIRSRNGGSIASLGNTGLGYGMPGKLLTTGGGDSWITIEFFKQYGHHGQSILGQAYKETLLSYINQFDMTDLESGHPKTVQQWVLLGDPSLQIGGYS